MTEPSREHESVLLVEPDAETRALAAFMLSRLGYRVTETRNAAEAIRLCDEQGVAFDLLLAEAVMARLNGRDLAQLLRERQPALRTLFLADPDYERLARREAARKGIRFLCRPFTMATLSAGVREALNPAGKAVASGARP
jgi:two-component system, cell cycle sensor histidine kinase and response regulator CckA